MTVRFFVLFLFVFATSGCAADKYLTTSDGVEISYEYKQAKNAKKGTVLLLHGLGSNLDEGYDFKKKLQKDGWNTMAIDLRGHGRSTQWKGEELNWRDFNDEARKSTLKDVETAVEFLSTTDPVWIVGASFGANLALVYAATHPDIDGLVLLSPSFNYGGVITSEAIERYRNRPLLLVATKEDPVSLEAVERMFNSATEPKKASMIHAEGGHGSAMLENVKNLSEDIVRWMNQN